MPQSGNLYLDLTCNFYPCPEGATCSMGDTYTQLHVQLVFAVKGRKSLIHANWEEELYKYITAVVQNDRHKLIAINGMPDHIHIFVGLNPAVSISDLVKDIKRASNNWINSNGFVKEKFEWQSGYGAFSYSRSDVRNVYNYILNQKEHHRRTSFRSEYVSLLELFEIEFKNEYLFEFYE